MQTFIEVFYNLVEFAFEYLRDSRRILAPLAKFFFSNYFCNMIVPLPLSCSHSCSRRAPTHVILTGQIFTNQLENYTEVWAKLICFVLSGMHCISAAGAGFTALSGSSLHYLVKSSVLLLNRQKRFSIPER